MTWLDDAEIERLTDRTRRPAQRWALDRLGIRYTVAANGAPLVRRDALAWACGYAADFEPPENAARYWWRSELVRRAGVTHDELAALAQQEGGE